MKKTANNLMSKAKNFALTVTLAALSGVMLGYALPWRCKPLLAWIVLTPLLIASTRVRAPGAVVLGIITSLTAGWIIGRPWHAPEQFGNLAGAFGVLGAVLGVGAAGFGYFSRRMNVLLAVGVAACLGVAAEYLSQWIFPVNLAIVHTYAFYVIQLASVTGVWGVSFVVWLSSATVAVCILKPRSAHLLAVMAVLVLIIYGWGHDKAFRLPPTERVRVSAVQAQSLPDLIKFSEEAAAQGADAILWPEGAVKSLDDGVEEISSELDVILVTGYTETRPKGKPFNSAAFIDRGDYIGSARKTHLLGKEKRTFNKGNELRTFTPVNFPTSGAAVCFDTNFTGVVRKLAANGAKVIFVPNSDPVTPSGALHFLHGAMMPIRAVENSVVIVRADSTGYSQIVHPAGWISAYLPVGEPGQITQEVILGSGPTIYTKTGDWFAWLSLLITASAFIAVGRRTKSFPLVFKDLTPR